MLCRDNCHRHIEEREEPKDEVESKVVESQATS